MTEYIVQIEDSEKNMSERFVGQLRSYPELIRCKDCKWWVRFGDSPVGHCHACKHEDYSDKWDISIRRRCKEDFYCADGERETDHD